MQMIKDFQGFVFFAASDLYISITFAQILSMPELSNVFAREISNKMYSPTAFYIARWFVSSILYAFQPLIYAVMAFSFIGFQDDSADNFQVWLLMALIQCLTGTAFGILFSTIFRNDSTAIMAVNLVQACLYFSCNMFTNSKNNIILDILSFISPFTYTTEGMMHILLNKV